jgi:hypothetical protein
VEEGSVRKDSSFSEEKEAKRLLFQCLNGPPPQPTVSLGRDSRKKSFCFFFFRGFNSEMHSE